MTDRASTCNDILSLCDDEEVTADGDVEVCDDDSRILCYLRSSCVVFSSVWRISASMHIVLE